MKKVLLSMVALAFISACTTDPYTGESRASRTAIGAGIGTAAGAGIGALIGGKDGALIGAGIGAVAGGGTGAYMDVQASKLRQELLDTGVQVVEQENQITLIMPGNITFISNDATLQEGFKPVLGSVAKVINEYSNTFVQVNGYTDNTGSAALNNDLSYRRANAVANYLKLKGVNSSRLLVEGYGSKNPIASNATVAGKAQNRRVEIVLINQE